ncbi:hypothetical protein ACFL0E_00815, partial [Nanoarchaeota archaeon]
MRLKKLSVFLVLAVFMISLVPAVVLAKDGEPVRLTFVKKSGVIKPTNIKLDKENVGKNVNAFATKVKANVNNAGNLTTKAKQALTNAKAQLTKAAEKYEQAKERYQTAKEKYLA